MDGENRKVVNGGASADGDTFGAFIPVEQPRQSQYFDVEEDVYEELASPKETDGSEDRIKALEEENQGFQHRTKEMERSEIGALSLAARVTELEEELARNEKDLVLMSSKAKDANAETDSLHLIVKTLQADKADLEGCIRDLETRIKEVDMAKALVKNKEEEIAHLNDELVFASNKAEIELFEKEVAREIILQKEHEINSIQEELKATRKKAIDDVVDLEQKRRVVVAQLEELNISLKEELSLSRENERKQLEMEKTAAFALAEKEKEVLSLKQEMLLAREKIMEVLEAENKEAEIFLLKERLNQAVVDARMREENLEKEIKQLKDMNSKLEGKNKELQFKNDSYMLVQGTHLTEKECPNISWASTATVAASSGVIAAAITAFCLHHKK